jgi:hypothetical protein
VDRHVRKGGQPVDDGRETARGLWTPAVPNLAGPATPAVENRFTHVDDRAGDSLRNPGFYSVISYRLGQHLPLAPVALIAAVWTRALVGVVHRALEPARVSVWVRGRAPR